MTNSPEVITIDEKIILIRDQRVMLDLDIAKIYGTTTKALNQQVKRNKNRFPKTFMFQLSLEEFAILKEQNLTAKLYQRRNPPYAFTEYGALMAANVLKSDIAIEMSIQIINAFVRIRNISVNNDNLSEKLKILESKVGRHDEEIQIVFQAIRELMKPSHKKKQKIGFNIN